MSTLWTIPDETGMNIFLPLDKNIFKLCILLGSRRSNDLLFGLDGRYGP